MKTFWLGLLLGLCSTAWSAEMADTPAAAASAREGLSPYPAQDERQQTRARLTQQRQQLEDQYTQAIKQCYQQFDVTSCRLKARDRRLAAHAALRQEELRFNAQERQIQAEETQRKLADRNNEATRQQAQTARAATQAASQARAQSNAKKQLAHAQQGSKRGAYEQKQREAAQHRADVEKKLRERNKAPAAPLPVPQR